MGYWIKLHAAHYIEPRMMKFRRLVGDSWMHLPSALMLVATSLDGKGFIGAYNNAQLAELLRYTGNPSKLRRAFEEAGYITRDGYIIDWEDIFALCASRQKVAQIAAAGRWSKNKQQASIAPDSTSDTASEYSTKDKKRGEESIKQCMMHEVNSHAPGIGDSAPPPAPPPASEWPEKLSQIDIEYFMGETGSTLDEVLTEYPVRRDRELKFGSRFDKRGRASFCDDMRRVVDNRRKASAKQKTHVELPPADWREILEQLHPNNRCNREQLAWSTLPPAIRKAVLEFNRLRPS